MNFKLNKNNMCNPKSCSCVVNDCENNNQVPIETSKVKLIENSLNELFHSVDSLFLLNIKISGVEEHFEKGNMINFTSLEDLLNLLPEHLNGISEEINAQISEIDEKLF